MMKIAVTYENGQIFQHFGHTEQFKVYAVEAFLTNNLGYNPNVKCDHNDHEHGNGAHSCGGHSYH